MSTDIIDRIDELVDEQLDDGEHVSDYLTGDHAYPRCPHCGRHWHGLRITERIAHMYGYGVMDPDYTAADDDSPVVCEGSDFIGPRQPPKTSTVVAWPASGRRELGVAFIMITSEGFQESMRRFRAAMHQMEARASEFAREYVWPHWEITGPVTYRVNVPAEPVPADAECAGPNIEVTFGPQYWGCEMRRIPPAMQFPRALPYFRWSVSPLDAAVRNLWPEFTAIDDHAPPRPGYDFSHYAEDPQHGPPTPHPGERTTRRGTPATARRRKARARG